jgi:hypothetical protein
MKPSVSKSVRLCVFLVATGLALTATAQSGNLYQSEVSRQLQLVQAAAALELGYALQPSHDTYYVHLYNNTYQDVRYTLQAGRRYVFVGACDNDCSGLQLTLYDGYGQLVDSDRQADLPVVATTVGSSGAFYLRVTMRGCHVQPCWAGVGAYN